MKNLKFQIIIMVEYLSEDKIEECKEVFDLFDKDNDGTIGIRELEELFHTLGSNATHELLISYLEKQGKEDLSSVNFIDFLNLFVKFKDPDIEEDISNGFEIFSNKNTGTISLKELVHVLNSIGEPLSLEEIKTFFGQEQLNINDLNQKITYNGKEEIDKSTFIKLMLNQVD